jgi:hypothetical protein
VPQYGISERDRAEQEARHIAEEARRRATIAVKGSGIDRFASRR